MLILYTGIPPTRLLFRNDIEPLWKYRGDSASDERR